MATRSFIGVQVGENLFEGVYCHHDGYPLGVGVMLLEHYSDRQKILDVIKKGDFSALRVNPDEISHYNEEGCGSCVYEFNSEEPDFGFHTEWEYAYILTTFNQWLVIKRDVLEGCAHSLMSLERAIADNSVFLMLNMDKKVENVEFCAISSCEYGRVFDGATSKNFTPGQKLQCKKRVWKQEDRDVTVYELQKFRKDGREFFLIAVSENAQINPDDIMITKPLMPGLKSFVHRILENGIELKNIEEELASDILYMDEKRYPSMNCKGIIEQTREWNRDVAKVVACKKEKSMADYVSLRGNRFANCMVVRIGIGNSLKI